MRTPPTNALHRAPGRCPRPGGDGTESFLDGFRCAGQFEKRLPAGKTRVRVTRGFECAAEECVVTLSPDAASEVRLKLHRRVDLRRRGWYAGDSHDHMIHGERTIPVGFDSVALSARAEDLQYLSLAQAWTIERPTPESLAAELDSRSTPDCRLTWNLEAPKNYYRGDAGKCLGHCWNVAVRGRTPEGLNVIASSCKPARTIMNRPSRPLPISSRNV